MSPRGFSAGSIALETARQSFRSGIFPRFGGDPVRTYLVDVALDHHREIF